jgi:Cu(I)/Ag(I) efflux system membrane protein CusA/SilA
LPRGADSDRPGRAGDDSARPGGEISSIVKGAPAIRTENALLSAYIFVDIRERDIGGYVADAPARCATRSVSARLLHRLERPVRVHGARHREAEIVVPLTLLIIFLSALPQLPAHDRDADRHALGALCAGRRRLADVAARLQPEVAVAVGFIALAGVAAETGVVMLIYLDHAWVRRQQVAQAEGRQPTSDDLYAR